MTKEQAVGQKNALEIRSLDVFYGPIHALKDVSLDVPEGQITALLGANGAGKTTLLRTISGLLRPKSGSVKLYNEELVGLEPHLIVGRGVSQSPEGRQVFPTLTVEENLQMGGFTQKAAVVERATAQCFALFPKLAERRGQLAGSLSGGEQQMLAIARGMMSGPRLMILDEPSLGLAPLRVQELFRLISAIAEEGVSVLLVEQNVHQSLKIAHRGYVMEKGATVLGGTGQELLGNDYVRRAFLGR